MLGWGVAAKPAFLCGAVVKNSSPPKEGIFMPNADAVSRQIKGHLQSLKQAGVEWLPRAVTPLVISEAQAISPPSEVQATVPAPVPVVTVPSSAATPAGTSALTLDQRRQALRVLAAEVSACSCCAELASTRTQTVFADGQPDVDLCFVGEAPGADEDAQGLPFVGAAGQLLNKIIGACGFKRDQVYICNILKCRPPGNRTPLPNEAANCRSFLERQIDLVQPKFICALGGCAAQNLLGSALSIGKLRGRFHDFRGIPVIVTYHPAYLLPHRAPEKKREVWEDMKMLLTRMGKPIPPKGN
jgi:uracil-DNA glycosylase